MSVKGMAMISLFYVVLRFLLLRGLLTITLLFSVSAASAREQIVWEGVETFVKRNVPGQISTGPPPQEVNVDFTTVVNFTYVEEVDSEGRRSFISRKIRWKLQAWRSIQCRGRTLGGGEMRRRGNWTRPSLGRFRHLGSDGATRIRGDEWH
jgi:hypothetical protein